MAATENSAASRPLTMVNWRRSASSRVAVIDEFLTTVRYRPNRSLTAENLVFRERTTAERRLAVI
ncbi:hypothetical protein C1J05_11930 [Sulfitobacter sp. JL08]|nr:hypothetical protein C1J05_11930 [Sulfitobacter sp. JL08]